MGEESAVTIGGYEKLIKEAFIDPIRTVVVVDDEYPTLDALLAERVSSTTSSQWQSAHLAQVREIIGFCRQPEHRWMVEIHDGGGEEVVAQHLHHSDLMILDYHLNSARPDDNSAALRILRELAANDHFNLVVVYTKGYAGAGGDIERVSCEIALALCCADERLDLGDRSLKAIDPLLDEWSDSDATIRERILEAIDDGVYLKTTTGFVTRQKIDWNAVCTWPELAHLHDLSTSMPATVGAKLKTKHLTKWALHQKQRHLRANGRLADEPYGRLGYESNSLRGGNWIRTDRLFVTVVSKADSPSLLPEKLLAALCLWDPEPHRLLMAKMRSALDERGVAAEDRVLDNRHLQAGWLKEYLTPDPDERTWKIQSTVQRHWEGLGDVIHQDVSEFAQRVAGHLSTSGGDEKIIPRWYDLLDDKQVAGYMNCYACSKPKVDGWHLTTGQVLRLESGAGADKRGYWLCLSPACDLVPERKKSGWYGRLGEHVPFIAVELHEVKTEAALASATGGNQIFLQVEQELKCFSFTPPVPEHDSPQTAGTPNPRWEQMFAANRGKFGPTERALSLIRACENESNLIFITQPAQIVAHLRYEYALNLLQRLGVNLCRIGLDFSAMPAAKVDGQTQH